MGANSLSEDLSDTLNQLAELQEMHTQAQAYHAAQERTSYLRTRFKQLALELQLFALLADLTGQVHRFAQDEGPAYTNLPDHSEVAELHRLTLSDIKRLRPGAMEHLGRALINNDLELLAIAEYVAASVSLLQERRANAVANMLRALEQAGAKEGDTVSRDSPLVLALRFMATHRELGQEQLQELQALTGLAVTPAP
ncbi:MAG TPA: hypothetical protein VJ183_13360 [Chloroflexia bacterium]|nr:hypothetical protein [Chloroflexia bacterium]